EHPGRGAEDDPANDEPKTQPEELSLPDRGDERRDVRLACRVQRRESVQRERADRGDERFIELAGARQHSRWGAGGAGGAVASEVPAESAAGEAGAAHCRGAAEEAGTARGRNRSAPSPSRWPPSARRCRGSARSLWKRAAPPRFRAAQTR